MEFFHSPGANSIRLRLLIIKFICNFVKSLNIFYFNIQSLTSPYYTCTCVAAVERLPALHYSVEFIFLSFGMWNFETIRGSLMKPKWQKLASLAQEICTL